MKVQSGAMDEYASYVDLSNPPCAIFRNEVYKITHRQSQYGNDSLWKGMKQIIQQNGQILIANKVNIATVEFAK
jgi:hypothetical protein